MTEQSSDTSKKIEGKKKNESKQHERQPKKDNNSYSDNDQSSVWSKESVINQIKNLSEELDKERKECKIEKQERLKEKEENKLVIENLMHFQQLLLNINDEDTNEEVGLKVKSYAQKLKRITNKQQVKNTDNQNRQKEIKKELNLLNNAGLQSPPIQLKSDSSSKITSHSEQTEKR